MTEFSSLAGGLCPAVLVTNRRWECAALTFKVTPARTKNLIGGIKFVISHLFLPGSRESLRPQSRAVSLASARQAS
jgi:hypothetical protein